MYINGRNAVIEALRSEERVEKVFLLYGLEGEPVARIRSEAKRAGVPCVTMDRRRFTQLERSARMGTRSQGVIAMLAPVDYVDIDVVVENAWRDGRPPLIAVLDGITDPHNVGAIIRSAECAGFDGIVLGKRDSSGITDVVVKTSAGAVNHIPIARVASLAQTLKRLQSAGLTVVGLDEKGSMQYTEHEFAEPCVVVIGSEGQGLSAAVVQVCDKLLTIPMSGAIHSLNASVAAGITFFEARRQRGVYDESRPNP